MKKKGPRIDLDLKQFRSVLEIKARETIDRTFLVEPLPSRDPTDRDMASGDRNTTISIMQIRYNDIKAAKEALKRVDLGTFGYCVECKGEISKKRIELTPWVALCMDCQKTTDSREREEILRSEFGYA